MTPHPVMLTPPRPGPAEEGRAIERAALKVFAREGCTRTRLDTVAAEAGVSVSTLLEHHRDRDRLLLAVVLNSSASVAAALADIAERQLSGGGRTDLEADLVAFGKAWLRPLADFPEHFALVRQLTAEVERLPADVLEVWRSSGPQRAEQSLARALRKVAELGLLDIEDACGAAERFVLLVAGPVAQRSFHGAVPFTDAETDALVTRGVRDFLRLYRPATAG
ncbi:TetR/AcrR family transcriptional regulator C-terminal domain-containing protein [Streptomyces sp. MUM 203J]|uniref:TetR/AcrR family transcriptional regulator C-terminal domain-containing protein n=1 Tax=Streptomyces sp. MUM 203J TaxID=2791990 RepID=UPI001F03A486|nr:TetR/AcrR family transcriptional regulator C-terminal domain-containing protein [Streptomyces sp. MUM 203J]